MQMLEYLGIGLLMILALCVVAGFFYGCGFDDGWQQGHDDSGANDDALIDARFNERMQKEEWNG